MSASNTGLTARTFHLVAMTIVALTLGLAMTISANAEPRHKSRKSAPSPAFQTATFCTKGGCKPLPRGCHAEPEYTWEGSPTGYEFAVCP